MLDALYQDSTNRALDDLQARPGRPPEPNPGMFAGLLSAAPRGVASGGIKVGAAQANVAEGFGTVIGAFDPFGASIINRRDPELVARERADALKRIEDNRLLQSEVADALRAQTRAIRPDPATTGFAAQAVFGVTDFVTQAAASYTMGGPLAAAGGTALSEGGASFDELRTQGVDAKTAAKVAAVRGTAAAVTVALPVAGTTLARTAGLVAAGGPGTYIAENLAAREILKAADYSRLAEQTDPFDPLGLTVATGAAALFGFGSYYLRGLRAARQADAARAEGAPAEAPGQRVPTPDEVDAAHVVLAREVADSQTLARPGDLAGDAVDAAARERAEVQLATGERVEVADLVNLREGDALPAPVVGMMERLRERLGEELVARRAEPVADPAVTPATVATEGAAARPAVEPAPAAPVDATFPPPAEPMMIKQVLADDAIRAILRDMRNETGWAQIGGKMIRADAADWRSEVIGRTTWIPNADWWPGRPNGLTEAQVKKAIDKALSGKDLTKRETEMVRYLVDVAREREALRDWWPSTDDLRAADEPVDPGEVAMVARAAALDEARVEDLAKQYEDDGAAFMRAIKEWMDGEQSARPAEGSAQSQRPQGSAEPARGTGAQTGSNGATQAIGDTLPDVVAARQAIDAAPQMEVELADGTRMKADEALRTVQEQAAVEIADSQLLRVAAACSIGT
jgi:hypothetical protein